jgi:thiol-disulfide isomerase/thioredoxin
MSKTINRDTASQEPEYDEYEEGYDSYEDAYEGDPEAYEYAAQPRGLFGTPARAIAVLGSVALLVTVLVVAVVIGTSKPPQNPQGDGTGLPGIRVGDTAIDFNLLNVRTGEFVPLSSLRGKPVFVNFWGTWCPPCREEMPAMQELYNRYKGQMEFVGVSMAPRDNPELVKGFVEQAQYDWMFVHDGDYNVATQYQVQAVPSSWFIDSKGVIRAVHVGGMNSAMMEAYIGQLR